MRNILKLQQEGLISLEAPLTLQQNTLPNHNNFEIFLQFMQILFHQNRRIMYIFLQFDVLIDERIYFLKCFPKIFKTNFSFIQGAKHKAPSDKKLNFITGINLCISVLIFLVAAFTIVYFEVPVAQQVSYDFAKFTNLVF